MPLMHRAGASLGHLDDATRELVRVAATLAGGSEDEVRAALQRAVNVTPHAWIEEMLLQTYLFAGFPRALNAMREWRRVRPAVATEPLAHEPTRSEGEATCATVYGTMYDRLRDNIRHLHPLLDDWMITEGYGKVLSRPGLDLARRELCIVAACAATLQDRQLHSHLHGARNAGVAVDVVDAALNSLTDVLGPARLRDVTLLWARVRGK